MPETVDHSDGTGQRGLGRVGSTVVASLAWLLVGVSFGKLGVALIEATSSSVPVSRTTAIVFVALLAIAGAFLVNDFQPTVLAALAYFVVEQIAFVWVVLVSRGLAIVGSPLSPWQEVGVRSIAIAIALALVFGGAGLWAVRWLRSRLRSILEVPPREPKQDDER